MAWYFLIVLGGRILWDLCWILNIEYWILRESGVMCWLGKLHSESWKSANWQVTLINISKRPPGIAANILISTVRCSLPHPTRKIYYPVHGATSIWDGLLEWLYFNPLHNKIVWSSTALYQLQGNIGLPCSWNRGIIEFPCIYTGQGFGHKMPKPCIFYFLLSCDWYRAIFEENYIVHCNFRF